MAENNKLRIFIDGGYLFNTFRPYREAGFKYSPKRLIRKLSENHTLVKVHYVDAINNRNPSIKEAQERFYYGKLRDTYGWEVDIVPLQWPGGVAKQKGADTTLAVKFHSLAVDNQYDIAVLIAADSDYCTTVELVKARGKIVRNAFFLARPSYHLTQACNGEKIILDNIDFIYKPADPKTLLRICDLP